jgi:hypothetical protein
LNAFAERFVRTIKEECLDRMILIGEGSLRTAVGQFCDRFYSAMRTEFRTGTKTDPGPLNRRLILDPIPIFLTLMKMGYTDSNRIERRV